MFNTKYKKMGIIIFLFIVLTFTIVATVFSPTNILGNIVSIIAILSGVSSILISLHSSSVASLEAVREYFSQSDSPEIMEARHSIYNNDEEKIEVNHMRTMCNFFEFWGMMVQKGYLPFWIFENAAGLSVLKVYYKISKYIEARRNDNSLYAKNFLWLVEQIENHNKEAVRLSKNNVNSQEEEVESV